MYTVERIGIPNVLDITGSVHFANVLLQIFMRSIVGIPTIILPKNEVNGSCGVKMCGT